MSLYQLEIARYVFHRHKSANDVSASSPSLPKIRIPKCMVSLPVLKSIQMQLFSIIRDVA
jgi:hypothetical protein